MDCLTHREPHQPGPRQRGALGVSLEHFKLDCSRRNLPHSDPEGRQTLAGGAANEVSDNHRIDPSKDPTPRQGREKRPQLCLTCSSLRTAIQVEGPTEM